MIRSLAISIIVLLITLSCSLETGEQNAVVYRVTLKQVASGLESPIGMAVPGDGTGRLFVTEQMGRIRIIKNGQLLSKPFLDISSKLDQIGKGQSEKGLLGMAFHPEYPHNGKFYIYYSAPVVSGRMDHKSVIEEYTVSSDPDVALVSGRLIMEMEQPESNHNGGQLCFGPDGYLYIGTGDGGGAGDRHGTVGNGQDLNTLLGKILRIDVDAAEGYKIPADNPFVEKPGRDEIFAYGLRNPWRFSFDRKTGLLFCADVGQNQYEEVNIIEKGKNYGWRIMEGFHCYDPAVNCRMTGLAFPINEYDHGVGKCVIGGYVYQGSASPDMQDVYVFGDWTGKIFMLLKPAATGNWERRNMTMQGVDGEIYINSFGEGHDGTLYVMAQQKVGTQQDGMVYELVFE